MFEDSLFSSTSVRGTGRLRWFIAASLAAQVTLLTGVLVVPLLWPAVLPTVIAARRMTTIALLKPQPKPLPIKPLVMHATNATVFHPPSSQPAMVATLRTGATIARSSNATATDDAPRLALGAGMGGGLGTMPSLGTGPGEGSGPIVRAATPAPAHSATPFRISSGVSAGLLLAPIQPVYPAIAKVTKTEGTVILTATIGKDGRITNLQVISGPAMLRNSALEAVQSARYRPFLLNGETTEVVTTISIVFSMAG